MQWQANDAKSHSEAQRSQLIADQQRNFTLSVKESTDYQVSAPHHTSSSSLTLMRPQTRAATFHGCEALERTIEEADGMKSRSEGSCAHVSQEVDALEGELGNMQYLYDKFKDPLHVSELCFQVRQGRAAPEKVIE